MATPPDVSSSMTPTSASARGWREMHAYAGNEIPESSPELEGVEDALMDLAQLEEMQQEADRMKALGNKHMAAQEFQRAYNSYSAALQLAPVGPSSHVFLSNRSAALLSLKRYPAAATDARRAIALAPTFGKAHARLGQALYFMKDYAGAVAAYEDALDYEPDNAVTKTYLDKARMKLEKQRSRGEEVSVADTMMTPSMSVVTDHNVVDQRNAVLTGTYQGRNRNAMMHAADGGDDPDFDEAVKIQQRANAYLLQKQYKSAIEEYTAALFLCPDDPHLSPDLHLGRAHALNGSRRHESAKNDSLLAIKLKPSPAAYSTLAKSYFYLRNYKKAIDAFDECQRMLPAGEPLGMFDQAYLEKAEAAYEEEEASLRAAGSPSRHHHDAKSPIPKLPPPRFVPREQAILGTPNLPPMPKQWPQQSPNSPSALKCGPERKIMCLSEALGVKLNRGPDGMVRILSVTPEAASSPISRQGEINTGDLLREAAGVDLRRPITNIMWGDTVALIKMAPRPIVLVVAPELSPVPAAVLEEQRKTMGGPVAQRPSPSSTDEAVRPPDDTTHVSPTTAAADAPTAPSDSHSNSSVVTENVQQQVPCDEIVNVDETVNTVSNSNVIPSLLDEESVEQEEGIEVPGEGEPMVESEKVETAQHETEVSESDNSKQEVADVADTADEASGNEPQISLRDQEDQVVRGEVLFVRDAPAAYCGWDSLRWMSYSGVRKVQFCQKAYRLVKNEKKTMFWSSTEENYLEGLLVVYAEPALILFVRRPTAVDELVKLLDVDDASEIPGAEPLLERYWAVESVADPATTKLRLSPLTTVTQPVPSDSSERAKSCFSLLTPVESIILSTVVHRSNVKKAVEMSYADSGSFLETTKAENAVTASICKAHEDSGGLDHDHISWKHQLVLGTLHAAVLSGNQSCLEEAVAAATKRTAASKDTVSARSGILPDRIVNKTDDFGLSALYYACAFRMPEAVQTLVNAGADVTLRFGTLQLTPVHICARNLDGRSLASLFSSRAVKKADANALTTLGRSPTDVAALEGVTPRNVDRKVELEQCLLALKEAGGSLNSTSIVKDLALEWKSDDLDVVLGLSPFRFPLAVTDMSLGGYYNFPLHHAVLSIHGYFGKTPSTFKEADSAVETLLSYGFEPNERMDHPVSFSPDFPCEFIGFTPLQVLAYIAIETKKSCELFGADEVKAKIEAIDRLANTLVRFGARLAIESPIPLRPRKNEVKSKGGDERIAELTASKTLEVHFGVENSLEKSKKSWLSEKQVEATRWSSIISETRASAGFPDAHTPGGSDEKSCAICWRVFGTIMSRRHKCRVSRRFVCDECASKRIVDRDGEHRISDGQFNLAKSELVRMEKARQAASLKKSKPAGERAQERKLSRAESTQGTSKGLGDREALFGGLLEQATNFVLGDDKQNDPSPAEVGSITDSLNDTRNALNERGQKLASLGEKSEQMVDASANFAKMAKELRKKSEGGLFW